MRLIHDTEAQAVTIEGAGEVADMSTRDWIDFARSLEHDDIYQAELIVQIEELRISAYFRDRREERTFMEEQKRRRQREPTAD